MTSPTNEIDAPARDFLTHEITDPAQITEDEDFDLDDIEITDTDDVVYLSASNACLGFISIFPETCITYMLVDEFSPSAMQLIWCLLYTPWFGKIAYGAIIDKYSYQPYAYARVALPCAVLVFTIILCTDDIGVFICLFILAQLFVSIADVVLDTTMVRRGKMCADKRYVQSYALFWRSCGGALGAYGGGWSYGHGGKVEVFTIQVLATLLFWSTSFLLENIKTSIFSVIPTSPRISEPSSFKSRCFEHFAISRELKLVLAFSFAVHAVPDVGGLFDYFQIHVLQFTPEMIGTLDMLGCLALVLGASLYTAIYQKVSCIRMMQVALGFYAFQVSFFSTIILKRINVAWGIPDGLWSMVDGFFRQVDRKLLIMPLSGAAIALCPRGKEGATYAMFTNVCNVASLVAAFSGSAIAATFGIDRNDMHLLWVVCVFRGVCFVCSVFSVRYCLKAA